MLEAGALVAAGEGIFALEHDFRVAHALDTEGGVGGLATADIDVDIVQRHVEGVIVARELVDDADDVLGRGLEVIRRSFQGRGRFVRGPVVVIGAGVREQAFGRRAVALRAFRAFGKGPAAGGVVRAFTLRVRASRTGVLAVGGVVGLGLFRGLGLVFLAAAVRRVAALGVAGVDHVFVFVFAVFYFERGRRGFGGRGCRGAAFGRAAAGGGGIL